MKLPEAVRFDDLTFEKSDTPSPYWSFPGQKEIEQSMFHSFHFWLVFSLLFHIQISQMLDSWKSTVKAFLQFAYFLLKV